MKIGNTEHFRWESLVTMGGRKRKQPENERTRTWQIIHYFQFEQVGNTERRSIRVTALVTLFFLSYGTTFSLSDMPTKKQTSLQWHWPSLNLKGTPTGNWDSKWTKTYVFYMLGLQMPAWPSWRGAGTHLRLYPWPRMISKLLLSKSMWNTILTTEKTLKPIRVEKFQGGGILVWQKLSLVTLRYEKKVTVLPIVRIFILNLGVVYMSTIFGK